MHPLPNIQYDFSSFRDGISTLEYKINQSNRKYDYICGIARGGLIPAVALSYRLNIPFTSFHWSLRDSDQKTISDQTLEILNNKNVLLVDDICDSGETLKQITQLVDKHVDKAVLVYNISQEVDCEYYHLTINRNYDKQWFDFWWDNKEMK
jgi:hypoxanthine phosphoribosyltransferase